MLRNDTTKLFLFDEKKLMHCDICDKIDRMFNLYAVFYVYILWELILTISVTYKSQFYGYWCVFLTPIKIMLRVWWAKEKNGMRFFLNLEVHL